MKEEHIVVDEDVHRMVKVEALNNDMTMRDYIRYLVEKDKQKREK